MSLTYDEKDDEADDEEGRTADRHSTGKFNERRKKQSGPKQKVKERPRPPHWDNSGSRVPSLLVVEFL